VRRIASLFVVMAVGGIIGCYVSFTASNLFSDPKIESWGTNMTLVCEGMAFLGVILAVLFTKRIKRLAVHVVSRLCFVGARGKIPLLKCRAPRWFWRFFPKMATTPRNRH
jgi:ABC-type uncharacterized transport system permease subunit